MREKAEKDKEKLLKGSTETAGSAPTVSAACTVSLIVDRKQQALDDRCLYYCFHSLQENSPTCESHSSSPPFPSFPQ